MRSIWESHQHIKNCFHPSGFPLITGPRGNWLAIRVEYYVGISAHMRGFIKRLLRIPHDQSRSVLLEDRHWSFLHGTAWGLAWGLAIAPRNSGMQGIVFHVSPPWPIRGEDRCVFENKMIQIACQPLEAWHGDPQKLTEKDLNNALDRISPFEKPAALSGYQATAACKRTKLFANADRAPLAMTCHTMWRSERSAWLRISKSAYWRHLCSARCHIGFTVPARCMHER